MNNNEWDEQQDISRFLEKFNQEIPTEEVDIPAISLTGAESTEFTRQAQYNASFEKLEAKIQELENKFAMSAAQNEAVLQELARTRRAVENQKSKDAVLANITATIAQLKASVEKLSYVHQMSSFATPNTSFEVSAPVVPSTASSDYSSSYKPDYVRAQSVAQIQAARQQTKQVQAALQAERQEKSKILHTWSQDREKQKREMTAIQKSNTEKTRVISALQQKASQLKAVNIALDREIKRVHQERLEALRKSAEQAKEILFLRDELSAAEERFKSFDFEGRIVSVKQQYEQKVSTLETQLHEVSTTCMKQVEEIEALKAENQELQKIIEEKESLVALYSAKTKELETLRETVEQLREESDQHPARLAAFTQRIQRLQTEQAALEERLETTQQLLQSVTDEKHTLEQNFQELLTQIKQNDTVIESLKDKIAVLTQENQELKNTQTTRAPFPPVAQREPVAVRQPAFRLTPRKVAHAAAETSTPSSTAPVEVHNVRSSVRSEADLPEIRVAHIPQEELYNGEDFLERTDSFIGRMKWSIFRDEK